MIADEIVHNSIPEDRIQFATTCKAFNQLVKDAKPEKIIRDLLLDCFKTDVLLPNNSRNSDIMTLPELKKILQQCQVENLSLYADHFSDQHFNSELMDLLMESCKFVTSLSITSYNPEFNYVDFYKKLRHLKCFKAYDYSGMIMNLPYFPPKLELQTEYSLPLLAWRRKQRIIHCHS
uniref:Uncharacterized protein n=1 Tax=Panagrolaimus sp. JU765 TaxID=591449 RepID=A0AC34PWC5_9BILA